MGKGDSKTKVDEEELESGVFEDEVVNTEVVFDGVGDNVSEDVVGKLLLLLTRFVKVGLRLVKLVGRFMPNSWEGSEQLHPVKP